MRDRLDREKALDIGMQGLAFLAEDRTRLERFLTLTGLWPDELRARAGEPGMLAAVLEHLLAHESLLLVFAAGAGLAPEQVAPAQRLLATRSAGVVGHGP